MCTVRASLFAVCALLAAFGSTACGRREAAQPASAPEPLVAISAPTGLDARRVHLGRRLFFDPVLSADGTISCATCHSLDQGGAEHEVTSTGIHGQAGPINSPTVLNSSFNFVQFWDGRARDLEEQATGPITNPKEMGASLETAVAAVRADPTYVRAFADAYPDGLDERNLRDAIAEYERSLVTPSRFDAYLHGNRNAITAQEHRGYETFESVGCTACHTGRGIGGSMFQKMGLVRDYFAMRGTPLTDADNGRYNVTHLEADRHVFKVPSLRNVALTAPYFHDGSRATLADAVHTMGEVQLGRELTPSEISEIVAFLGSLTGTLPPDARPPDTPPSVRVTRTD